MDTGPLSTPNTMIGMDRSNNSNGAGVLLWITFVIALSLMVYLFFANRSMANAVAEKQINKNDIIAQLSSPENVAIEDQANAFKGAFTILSEISANRLPKKDLLTELYGNFTKDVKVRNLALASDGTLTIDGSAASYRGVADFMVGLSAYRRASDVKLASVALSSDDKVAVKEKVVFSVTAKLNMAKAVPETITESSDTSTVADDSTGGTQ